MIERKDSFSISIYLQFLFSYPDRIQDEEKNVNPHINCKTPLFIYEIYFTLEAIDLLPNLHRLRSGICGQSHLKILTETSSNFRDKLKISKNLVD